MLNSAIANTIPSGVRWWIEDEKEEEKCKREEKQKGCQTGTTYVTSRAETVCAGALLGRLGSGSSETLGLVNALKQPLCWREGAGMKRRSRDHSAAATTRDAQAKSGASLLESPKSVSVWVDCGGAARVARAAPSMPIGGGDGTQRSVTHRLLPVLSSRRHTRHAHSSSESPGSQRFEVASYR